MVLKGLTNAPTGAIAAAATTSLPESPGGCRNWDYRFSWIRDSCFTVKSLSQHGYVKEANGFRRFIERSAAGSADQIQIVFGLGGERWLPESEIKDLKGTVAQSPCAQEMMPGGSVNWTHTVQLLDLAYRWHIKANLPTMITGNSSLNWYAPLFNPGAPGSQHLGAARRTASFRLLKGNVLGRARPGNKTGRGHRPRSAPGNMEKEPEEVRMAVETKGYDADEGYLCRHLTIRLWMLPCCCFLLLDFVDYRDERMIRTTDAVWQELEEGGLLRRYAPCDDGLPGLEGVFLPCSFWLAECLARQGRADEAIRSLSGPIHRQRPGPLFRGI